MLSDMDALARRFSVNIRLDARWHGHKTFARLLNICKGMVRPLRGRPHTASRGARSMKPSLPETYQLVPRKSQAHRRRYCGRVCVYHVPTARSTARISYTIYGSTYTQRSATQLWAMGSTLPRSPKSRASTFTEVRHSIGLSST